MTNPPEHPPGSPLPPNGPPPGWLPPPPAQPLWQGHQAPQQSAYDWQQPAPPRKRRTWLVAGIVAALLLVAGGVAAALALARDDDSPALAVAELTDGMCLRSPDLAAGRARVDDLVEAPCEEDHDAEVFATLELAEDETFDDAGARCAEALGDDYAELTEAGIEVRPLAETDQPAEGDTVVCFLRREDGEQLSDNLV